MSMSRSYDSAPCWCGGQGGIRTPGTVARTPHFECGAIDHSATSPWPAGRKHPTVGRYVAKARWRDKCGGRRQLIQAGDELLHGGDGLGRRGVEILNQLLQ